MRSTQEKLEGEVQRGWELGILTCGIQTWNLGRSDTRGKRVSDLKSKPSVVSKGGRASGQEAATESETGQPTEEHLKGLPGQ